MLYSEFLYFYFLSNFLTINVLLKILCRFMFIWICRRDHKTCNFVIVKRYSIIINEYYLSGMKETSIDF
jgi:hypothetical protein